MIGDATHESSGTTLAPWDEVVLVTSRSTYHFVVGDSDDRCGILHGGNLAEGRRGVFCGVFDDTNTFHPAKFRVGARALFLVASPSDHSQSDASPVKRVLTSKLREVRVVRRRPAK
jgi:hypothetical protein